MSAQQKWVLRFERRAEKEFTALALIDQKRIRAFFENRLLPQNDPRAFGKPLSGTHKGLWRYRIGDCRVVAKLEENIVTISVIRVGHRREVYR